MKAPSRIVVTAVVSLMVGACGVAFAATRLDWMSRTTGVVESRLEPARDHLVKARLEGFEANRMFNRSLLRSDLGERGELMTSAFAHYAATSREWAQFRRLAVGLPGERELVEGYERESAENTDAGEFAATIALATSDLADPALQMALAAYHDGAEPGDQVDALIDLYDREVDRLTSDLRARTDATRGQLLLIGAIGTVVVGAVATRLARVARRRDREVTVMEREQHRVAERNAFEATVHRALEMAADERGAFRTMSEALAQAVGPDQSVMVHLAEGAQVEDVEPGAAPPVVATSPLPSQCVASQRGQTFVFPSSAALDACPVLKADPGGPASAVCVPLSIAGLGAGAIRVRGPVGEPPDDEVVARVQLVARKIGERVAMLRAFAHTESLAATDPLTELPNRRSFEARAALILPRLTSYSVLFGDLDRFKLVNDVHGHDAGDRALRVFSGALTAALRPDDLACRFGGEEFVVLLPGCEPDEAVRVAERIRATLASALDGADVPPFTVSFGVASSVHDAAFDDVLELADRALLRAKAEGRDRVVAVDDGAAGAPDGMSPAPQTHAPRPA